MVRGASLGLASGEVVRYGPDEVGGIPSAVSWDTQLPGGFGPASVTVPRPAGLHKDDQLLYADVRIYGDGNRTLYEGYVTGVPQADPDFCSLLLAGHATLLERIQNFRQVFVDRNLNRWDVLPSASRQLALNALTWTSVDQGATVDWDIDASKTTLKLTLGQDETNPYREVYYDAGPGCRVAGINYQMSSKSVAGEIALVGFADDNSGSNLTASSDLLTGTDSSASGTFTSTPRRYGLLAMGFTGAMGAEHFSRWNLAVYGNHPVPLQGSHPKGVFAGDVMAYLVSLSPLSGMLGVSIERTAQIVPHLVFAEDVSLQAAIEQVTALGGSEFTRNDWGVYENKEFFWLPPGSYGRTWRVRRDQTATKSSDGPDVDLRTAGVKVTFQDVSGKTLSVGPPGSNSDFETSRLVDSDPSNPAHRIPGMWLTVDIGMAPVDADGTPSAAINYGVAVLNTRNRLAWRGSLEVSGFVKDEHGNRFPAGMVRAGDRLVVEDDGPEELPVTSTSYSDDTGVVRVDVGARPDTLEAHLAQLAAATELTFG